MAKGTKIIFLDTKHSTLNDLPTLETKLSALLEERKDFQETYRLQRECIKNR